MRSFLEQRMHDPYSFPAAGIRQGVAQEGGKYAWIEGASLTEPVIDHPGVARGDAVLRAFKGAAAIGAFMAGDANAGGRGERCLRGAPCSSGTSLRYSFG